MDESDPTRISSRRRDPALWGVRGLVVAFVTASLAVSSAASAKEDGGFADADEQAFKEFAEEAADSKSKKVKSAVEEQLEEIAERMKLDAPSVDKLAGHAAKIEEATRQAWIESFQKSLRPSLVSAGSISETLEAWNAKDFASNSHYASVRPDRTGAWREALADVLDPAQLAKYEDAEKAKSEKLRLELEDHFLRCEQMAIARMDPIMQTEIEQLKSLARLEDDRSEALQTAARTAIDATVEEWLKEWKDQVLEMGEEQRKQRTGSNASPPLDVADKYNPTRHQKWKDTLAEVLSEEELAGVEKRRKDRRDARAAALAMFLVDEIDPYVGLTQEQRTKLTERFGESLTTLPDQYYTAQPVNHFYSINPGQMFSHLSGIVEEEVMPMLDEGQAERWKRITRENLAPNRYSARGKLDGLEIPPAEEIDEIEARRLLTAYMYLQAKGYTEIHRAKMDALAAGVVRVGDLEPEKVALIRTAAKGAAQALAVNDIKNFESWARQNVGNVAPADLPARFKGSSMPRFSNPSKVVDPPIFASTIDRVLSDDQKKRWGEECEARVRWGQDSKVAILMTEVDKFVLLEPEKRQLLEQMLGPVLNDYQQELDNMFSYQWHIQGYYNLIPLMLLDEEELASVLDKEQLRVIRSRNAGHFDGMIKSLKNNHKSRKKADKKK